MRYPALVALAALASAVTCEGHADTFDVRYINPGTVTFDVLHFEVDGLPYVELSSGCPGPGDPTTGPVCVAQLQLGEGTHAVRARAFALDAGEGDPGWTVFSDTITVQGAPEPGLGAMVALGVLGLAVGSKARLSPKRGQLFPR